MFGDTLMLVHWKVGGFTHTHTHTFFALHLNQDIVCMLRHCRFCNVTQNGGNDVTHKNYTPVHSYMKSCLAFAWEWGCSWLCFDTNLAAFWNVNQNIIMLNSLRSLSKQSQLQLGSQAFCLVLRLQFNLFWYKPYCFWNVNWKIKLAVDWFLRRENNRWLGWKRITQNIRTFDGRQNGGWNIWAR